MIFLLYFQSLVIDRMYKFYTEEYSKETGWPDHLRLALTSTELHNWLKGPAYE